MADLEFDKIGQEARGAYNQGRLKLTNSSVNFKNSKANKTEQIQIADVEHVYWIKRSKGYCFKLVSKSGTYRFDGFSDTDLSKIEEYSQKHWKMPVEKTDISAKGWNWGKANFIADSLNFEVDGKLAYDIPLKNVSNTNMSKNEGILQFHQNEEACVSLMEIRFHIPSSENDVDLAQEFYKKVMHKADVISAEGDAICALTELNCLTPRGRYDVKFFCDFIDLHGKTFDYKIPYTNILRLFLLPHKDNRQMFFVMALDPPIKQGQTRYNFLIILQNNDESVSVDVTFSERAKERLGDRLDKLDKNISGPSHEVLSRICRAILDKRITVPGTFTSSVGSKCLACSYKANSGFLYPLERGFMFVHKPPLHFLFTDIESVTFSRSNQGHVRSFDFEIDHKNGTKHPFSSIEKNEQENLYEFVKQKGIKIKKSGKEFQSNFQSMVSDDEEKAHDPYAERMKAEGRERENNDDDDDDDESEDEDFHADSDNDDDELEYDSDASVDSSDSQGSGEDGSPKKKKKESSPKKKDKGSPKKKSSSKAKSSESSGKSKKDNTNDSKIKSKDNADFKSKEFVESGEDSSSDAGDSD